MPSSPTRTVKCRRADISDSPSSAAMAASALRCARTSRSTWLAVASRANSSSRVSFPGVAIRVRARVLDQESRPFSISAAVRGSEARQRATRTRSRAGPSVTPVRQESQWAQERHPVHSSARS